MKLDRNSALHVSFLISLKLKDLYYKNCNINAAKHFNKQTQHILDFVDGNHSDLMVAAKIYCSVFFFWNDESSIHRRRNGMFYLFFLSFPFFLFHSLLSQKDSVESRESLLRVRLHVG